MRIETVGVVGAGVMGGEIAEVMVEAGLRVVLLDVDAAALARGRAHVRAAAERRARRGALSASAVDELMDRVATSEEDAPLAGCQVVIEAVPEMMDVKTRVLARIENVMAPDAVLATNTSGLSVTALGRAAGRPARTLGLHFFNPASMMPLVEVVRGEDTAPEAVEIAEALARRVGKTPIRVAECPGFLVNRVLVRALAAAYREAASRDVVAADADAAVVASGPAPMGPFALGDLIGLDTLEHIRRDLDGAYDGRFDDGGVLAPLVAAGRLGRKSGAGLVAADGPEGDPGAGRPVADAYYGAARDEAARCVADGVAADSDVDLALRLGAGWSAGPLESAP